MDNQNNWRTYIVTEWCPNCESEIEMRWNVESDGYRAYCPVCGNILMLCDECQHSGPEGEYTGRCSYDSESGKCKHNQFGFALIDEFAYLRGYLEQSPLDEDICRDRLRMLWTAFCLHRNYSADTSEYDGIMLELWGILCKSENGTSDWHDYNSFYNFMTAYLV